MPCSEDKGSRMEDETASLAPSILNTRNSCHTLSAVSKLVPTLKLAQLLQKFHQLVQKEAVLAVTTPSATAPAKTLKFQDLRAATG